jgi:hypothetical protein
MLGADERWVFYYFILYLLWVLIFHFICPEFHKMLGADDKKELKEYILKIKSELAQVSFFSSEKIKHKYQHLPKLNLSWRGFLFFSF